MNKADHDLRPTVIVGLGNPGAEYAATRHNVGFMVIDQMLSKLRKSATQEHRYDSLLYRVSVAGRPLLLVKPQTYMNLSGQAVAKIRAATQAATQEILVVMDCLDLPVGKLRLRAGGGSGGHRGIESMIRELGDDRFPRLRVGIGRAAETSVVDYVLGGFSADEQATVHDVIDAAADAVLMAVRAGFATAMNRFNGWSAPTAPSAATPN